MVLHYDNVGKDIIFIIPSEYESNKPSEAVFEFTLGIAALCIKLGLMSTPPGNHEELHRLLIDMVSEHLQDWRNGVFEL